MTSLLTALSMRCADVPQRPQRAWHRIRFRRQVGGYEVVIAEGEALLRQLEGDLRCSRLVVET